jgi:exopolyphosphatase/guanosine-5'-triphosphate,3'-diphosphate pyrophosphatase
LKRIAIIDLGTNTFNLLIINKSENDYSKVYETKVGVGLGFGGINKNIIQENALLRGLDTLKSYKEKCDELKVDSIFAFGTSALRNAENREDFLTRAKLEANIDIEVISVNGGQELNRVDKIIANISSKISISTKKIIKDIYTTRGEDYLIASIEYAKENAKTNFDKYLKYS